MQRFFITTTLIFLFHCNLFAGDWQVDKDGDNQVLFKSTTTLLDFEGTTKNIDGYLYWEGENMLPAGTEFYLEVQPATFETGIGKRDSDMRSDVLETYDYPISSFKGTLNKSDRDGNTYNVIASGMFDLHGVEKKMEIPVTITQDGKKLKVKTEFSILLKDYNIEAPSLMAFVKVAQEITLEVKFELLETGNGKE
ncbi:MAG: YceI family protein [Calditrichae bacterium]|nr:YceI family protein [Calditrichia bacterium]